ncbi:MAG TPA: hypothetical protein PK536_11780 [Ignavibacteria bacterium]|nr:hypothetical protein [Bacteroidota bacterium]HRI86114.1 hypothetical protein [Ignavibacteria bacterium]
MKVKKNKMNVKEFSVWAKENSAMAAGKIVQAVEKTAEIPENCMNGKKSGKVKNFSAKKPKRV